MGHCMANYNPQQIEAKWAKAWERKKAWQVDLKKVSAKGRKPYYNLMMFPYPSAEGLHVGNVYAFTGSDIHGRFRRMQGFDVFEPMGFDSFGIHSENFAIKKGTHPKAQTAKNISNFRKQLKAMGALFDWSREVVTSEPTYYKWTQWLFLQLFKMDLAYEAKAPVDWCPSCKTVLADEQVIDEKCERCGTEVIQKELEQWFFRITKYADKLLKNLETIDWSERTKIAQRNWIGRSEGTLIDFKIQDTKYKIQVFTTRPDTLFGATYMVLAPEHNLVDQLKSQITNWQEVEAYRKEAKKKNEVERTEVAKEKTGVQLKGVKAINPANQQEIPVWIADYVLASYGTGAIMAVPAHDQRDWEFAQKYDLPILMVVCPHYPAKTCPVMDKAYLREGHLVASGQFDGMPNEKAKWEVTKFVGGKRTAKYHLRDWLISRQRYWGPPIPIIYCEKCGTVPVPEKDLPVLLPNVKDFRPTGTEQSSQATIKEFYEVACPKCKGKARRETDVSDTFLDSAWYFFRYTSTEDQTQPWKKDRVKKWLPVNMYIGGAEHSVLHLLYSRFLSMVFKDIGLYSHFEEPYTQFRAHGLIISEGAKMSKSKGNVVNPDKFIGEYGADTLRTYLMFIGPFDQGGDFREQSIIGVYRFFQRFWALQTRLSSAKKLEKEGESWMGMTVAKVGDDTKNLRFNTAISAMMEWVNYLYTQKEVSQNEYRTLLILLASYGPHMTEELWKIIGEKYSVHQQKWPAVDIKALQKESVNIPVQVNGKLRAVLTLPSNEIKKDTVVAKALELEAVQKHLSGKKAEPIYVEGKILNLIVK